jgi:protein-disulfide isomerase
VTEAESWVARWQTWRPWLGTVVRLFLGIIWIWASLEKLKSPRTFVQAVRAYDMTPEWMSKAIGYGLPVLEFSLGVLLILGIVVRMAAIASVVLFVVFLIGVSQAAGRGLKLECGCFGGGGETVQTHYTIEILRDLGLLALAVYLALWSFSRFSVEEFLARHDYVEPPSAKRMRSDEGRRKYLAQLEQKRKDARERGLWVNGSLAVVVVLIAIIGIGVQANRAKISGDLIATNATVKHGVTFGKTAAATIDLYEDFQCPNCLNLEKAIGTTLDADVRANRAQVHYHPIAILDASSNNDYSTRAANAALCASDVSVDMFVAYHNTLYGTIDGKQVQPPEGGGGRSNTQLIGYAQHIGMTGTDRTTFASCVQGETHKALVEAMTEDASKNGINGTPTIKVNGKNIDATLAAYKAAVAKALENGPAPNPSKTPTPTPTTSAPSTSATTTKTPSTSPSA